MNTATLTIDDRYRHYCDLLLRHHHLLSQNADETADIEAVEEEMTRLWEQLDSDQRMSLSGLGSDLGWVRRKCLPAPRGRRPDEISLEEIQGIIAAREAGDWHAMLHQLRLCTARLLPIQLAEFRATAWSELKFPEVATIFAELADAIKKEPFSLVVLH